MSRATMTKMLFLSLVAVALFAQCIPSVDGKLVTGKQRSVQAAGSTTSQLQGQDFGQDDDTSPVTHASASDDGKDDGDTDNDYYTDLDVVSGSETGGHQKLVRQRRGLFGAILRGVGRGLLRGGSAIRRGGSAAFRGVRRGGRGLWNSGRGALRGLVRTARAHPLRTAFGALIVAGEGANIGMTIYDIVQRSKSGNEPPQLEEFRWARRVDTRYGQETIREEATLLDRIMRKYIVPSPTVDDAGLAAAEIVYDYSQGRPQGLLLTRVNRDLGCVSITPDFGSFQELRTELVQRNLTRLGPLSNVDQRLTATRTQSDSHLTQTLRQICREVAFDAQGQTVHYTTRTSSGNSRRPINVLLVRRRIAVYGL